MLRSPGSGRGTGSLSVSSGHKNQYTSRAASCPVSIELEWPRTALIAAYVGFVMDGTMPLLEPGVDSDCPEEGCMGSVIPTISIRILPRFVSNVM